MSKINVIPQSDNSGTNSLATLTIIILIIGIFTYFTYTNGWYMMQQPATYTNGWSMMQQPAPPTATPDLNPITTSVQK